MKKSNNIMFAVAMAALLNVPTSELMDAQNVFVQDFKMEGASWK